eukprot:NODE_34_length_36538_cov_0.612854.p24 type:complete len:145 gc:universal NODE_34_length_36538_cov_0.612854:33053-33487(+)
MSKIGNPLEIHNVIALILCKYHKCDDSEEKVADELKIISRNTRADYEAILMAVNYIYKLVVLNDHKLDWKPNVVFAVALWISCEIRDQIQIEAQKWHEKTQIPMRDLKLVETVFKGSLGHQLFLTAAEFDQFKSEFSKRISSLQ